MNLKNGKVFTSKSVGAGSASYEKRIYRAAVSQKLTNTEIMDVQFQCFLISVLYGRRYSASRPGQFAPGAEFL